MRKFYLHFAAAYGTTWLILVFFSIVNSSPVTPGKFQLYVLFPLLSIIYALLAINKKRNAQDYSLEEKRKIIEQKMADLNNEQIVRDGNQHTL